MPAIIWILSLSAALAAALNGTMVMPVIVLALGRIPGIDESLATLVASAEIAGIALYCLFLPRLAVRRRHFVAIGGIAALVAGEAVSHGASTVGALIAARLLAGLGEGALFSLIASQVAAMRNAERVWGQLNLIGGTAMGLLLYGLSLLPIEQDRGPIFLWLAAFAALTAPLILLAHRKPPTLTAEPAHSSLGPWQVGVTLLVVLLVYAVQAGQWAVSGYVGERSHLSAATIGFYLALSSVAGFAGAVVPSLTRNPAWRLPCVLFGLVVMIAALYCFFNIAGDAWFLGGQILVNVGFYMVTPFLTGLLTENDKDGALLMRTLVIALFGAAAGTAVAGPMLAEFGQATLSFAAAATLIIAAVCAAQIFYRLHVRLRVPGEVL